jgi:tRNA threonylcarbamoyladenosine biosynthesis protein TsaB
MLILAFDTSTAHGGVAIFRDRQLLAHASWERQGSHGENLTPQIQNCLSQASIELAAVEALAVGIGPGSFTGVRVAINAARSLGFALEKPVFAFDTASLIAHAVARTDLPLLVMINAHKNSVFAATFSYDPTTRTWTRTSDLTARDPAALGEWIQEPHLCVGDGFTEYEDLIPEKTSQLLVRDSSLSDFPQPQTFGILVEKSKPLEWKEIQALYIRESGAEEKLREGRKN